MNALSLLEFIDIVVDVVDIAFVNGEFGVEGDGIIFDPVVT
jgi:hypothetical protein